MGVMLLREDLESPREVLATLPQGRDEGVGRLDELFGALVDLRLRGLIAQLGRTLFDIGVKDVLRVFAILTSELGARLRFPVLFIGTAASVGDLFVDPPPHLSLRVVAEGVAESLMALEIHSDASGSITCAEMTASNRRWPSVNGVIMAMAFTGSDFRLPWMRAAASRKTCSRGPHGWRPREHV